MKRIPVLAAAVAATAVLAAGCGSSPPTTPANGKVIAHRLGCVGGYQAIGSDPALVSEGQCGTWAAGNTVTIYTFPQQADENNFLAAAGPGVAVTGHLWVVVVASETQAAKVVSLLGGTAH